MTFNTAVALFFGALSFCGVSSHALNLQIFTFPQNGSDLEELVLKHWDEKDHIDPEWMQNVEIGDGQEHDENGELTCIHFVRKMAMKGLPAFNECMKERQLTIRKLKRKLRENMPCMLRCVGTKLHILNEEGLFNQNYARDLLHENVPKRFMKIVFRVWDNCIESAKLIRPNDHSCKSYQPGIRCVVNEAFKVASEALELCPDVPDAIKRMAHRRIKARNNKMNSAAPGEEMDTTEKPN